jgi:hypothetical protein
MSEQVIKVASFLKQTQLKKAKLYLNPTQQKSPTPLTPVDEAWGKMAELLDSKIPVTDQETKKRAFAISFSQFMISVMAAMILVGGGTFITLKSIENKKEIHTTQYSVKHPKPDSLINKAVLIEDPAVSAETNVQPSINAGRKTNEEDILRSHQRNNHTTLSTTINQIHTSQKVVSVNKSNLNHVVTNSTAINQTHTPHKAVSVNISILNQIVTDSTVITKTQTSQKVVSLNTSDLNHVVADNDGTKTDKPTNKTNPVEKQHETVSTDSVNSQNHQPNSILPKDENLAKVGLETKNNLKNSFVVERNSLISKLPTKEKEKKENRVGNYPKNNHLFIGMSGNNGLSFSKNTSKNIYSYGGMLTVGIRNTEYNLSVETGIGFQSLEYHVSYSRTLYTYRATEIYDSTMTVSSYKYSRYNVIIPFFITKEIFRYNNIYFDVKTGINTSVLLSKQRLFNSLPADIQLVEDSYALSRLNFSFALSPQFRWDINDKFSFNINAGAEFYLNSLYRNYSLKPVGINLSAGVHYLF